MKIYLIHTALTICFILFAIAIFIIHNRKQKVNLIAMHLITMTSCLPNSDIIFKTELLPVIMKMYNPFTRKKPTIENYFSRQQIQKYKL